MNEARMLKIVGGEPAAFDALAWRRGLRGSGLLKELTRSELAVLWFAFDYADGSGEVDLPREYLAEQLGMSVKAARSAVDRLEGERGLLEHVGASPRASRVKRYRLAWPGAVPAGIDADGPAYNSRGSVGAGVGAAVRGSAPAEAGRPAPGRGGGCLGSGGGSGLPPNRREGEVGFRVGGSGLPVEGEVGFPQSKELKQRQCSSKAGAGTAPGEPGRPGLFAGPADFAAAAARILESCGLSRKVAAGLVSRYRPTRAEARNIRANMRARIRGGFAVHNPAGWVRACLQRGETAVERRLESELADRRAKRRRRAETAKRDQAARRSAEAAEREQERLAAAERELAGMSAAAVAELRAVVTAGLLPLGLSESKVRAWMVEELVKRGQTAQTAPAEAGRPGGEEGRDV